jgi:hypothetical protein
MKKLFALIALCMTACVSPADQPPLIEHIIVIKYRVPVADAASPVLLAELGRLARTQTPVFVRLMSGHAFVYRFSLQPQQKLGEVILLLRRSEQIEFAEPDILVKIQ